MTTTTETPKTKRTSTKTSTSFELQPNPFVFEVFDLIAKQKTKSNKILAIQKHRHDSLIALWLWNFTSLQSALPYGEVPYSALKELTLGNDTLSETVSKQLKSPDYVDSYGSNNRTTIRNSYTDFYIYIKGGNDTLSSIRRESAYIQLLEGLHPREAEIMILVKDKRLQDKYPTITFDLLKEALPDVTWDR